MKEGMLILASKSPRRKELLSTLGVPFFIAQSNAKEITENLPCDILVKENAYLKAKEILAVYPNDIILGADTVVTIDNIILGKPKSIEDAKTTLMLLSGKEHFVYTGVAIIGENIDISYVVSTKVVFKKLTPNIIDKSFSVDTPLSEIFEHPLVGLNVKNKDFSSLNRVFFCNDSSMLNTVVTAMSEYAHKSSEYTKVLQHIVCMILVMLSRNLSSTTEEDKENGFVSEIKNYINENFSSNVELSTICKKLGYNSHYVGNTFKKQTGLTFTEYLHKVRIKRACFLLTSTTMSIAQVANEIGYQNITYFYRVFKEKMGVDPKTFRNTQT